MRFLAANHLAWRRPRAVCKAFDVQTGMIPSTRCSCLVSGVIQRISVRGLVGCCRYFQRKSSSGFVGFSVKQFGNGQKDQLTKVGSWRRVNFVVNCFVHVNITITEQPWPTVLINWVLLTSIRTYIYREITTAVSQIWRSPISVI